MSLSIEEQQEKRKEIYKMMKETSNIEDYRNLEKEYKKIGCRLFHERNKNNDEYKQMKYNNLKKYLTNEENYNKHTEKNRMRNKKTYDINKGTKKNIVDVPQ